MTAKYCQKCGKPLSDKPLNTIVSKKKDKIAKAKPLFPFFWMFLALFFSSSGVASYLVWHHLLPKPKMADLVLSANTIKSDASNTADIQSYTTIKEVPNVPFGTFQFSGSLIFASLVAQGTHRSITQVHPQFTLHYVDPLNSQPGTGAGIEMLLNGRVSFALSARPLENTEYQKAITRNFKLSQVAVAIDSLAAYTHPDISIPGLSVSQLQDIYTGKITNWTEVGGPNLTIVPCSTNVKTTASLKTLLGTKVKNISPKVKSSRDYTILINNVASIPGAIGIGSAALFETQSKVRPIALAPNENKQYVSVVTGDNKLNMAAFRDNTYPITRYVYVVIRRDGKTEERAGVAYANLLLSKEGQQFVEKAGLVPINR